MASSEKRILICDDDPMIRKLLNKFLDMLGCEVVGQGANGSEAVALYNKTKPDLTLMDIDMPDINGVTSLNEILNIDSNARVIMLSALDDTSVAESCINKGAIDYIQKGISPDNLYKALEGIVAKEI